MFCFAVLEMFYARQVINRIGKAELVTDLQFLLTEGNTVGCSWMFLVFACGCVECCLARSSDGGSML